MKTMKTKTQYGLVLVLILIACFGFATQDRMAVTYQVIVHPDEGLVPFPVSFITFNSVPESEINAIDDPNQIEQRSNAPTTNGNLVSLYGIKVDVVSPSSLTGTVVLVDLSMSTPTNSCYQVSLEAVVRCTINCVKLCADRIGISRLEIRIKPPVKSNGKRWKTLEQVILKKDEI
jgi:hypothetical protein